MQESDGNVKGLRRIPEGSDELKIYNDIKTPLREKRKGAMELYLFLLAAGTGGELLAHLHLEHALAHAQILRRDLQQLVVVDELQALLKRERAHGDELHGGFGARGVADGGQVWRQTFTSMSPVRAF